MDDRKEFEAWARRRWHGRPRILEIDSAGYKDLNVALAWSAWAAARATPSAVEPGPKPVAWARNTAGGLNVCYVQEEPPRDIPWTGSTDPWIPLYTAPQPAKEPEAMLKDAERYRWRRANSLHIDAAGLDWLAMDAHKQGQKCCANLDAAIDTAIRESKNEG